MKRPGKYRVLELGGSIRGVKADELQALLNGADEEGWDLHQVIPRENSNKILAIFRRRGERGRQAERSAEGSWLGDWGFN